MHGQSIKTTIFRIIRIVGFLFGAYTTGWYLFSFIGILIGLSYFLLLQDTNWKRHGLVLAWISSFTSFILILIAFSNAAGSPSISTTYLAMSIGPGSLIIYLAIYFIHHTYKKQHQHDSIWKRMRSTGKAALVIFLCVFPIGLWWSVNIDLGVMLDNSPQLLWIHAPTTVTQGSDFDITVQAWDQYERVSAVYSGTITFTMQSYNLTTYELYTYAIVDLPSAYTFTGHGTPSDMAYMIQDGRDNGMHKFQVRISSPGIHYILVTDSLTENTYWSNPILVDNYDSSNSSVFWGDLHTHSMLSDGSGTPEHHYFYARYVACLDFCALSDHGETMQFTPGALDRLELTTNNVNIPGQFVSFQAVEWTQANAGHLTCIYSGSQITKNPPVSFFALPKASDLWNVLDEFTTNTGCRALAIPHHTTKEEYPQDWTYINPKYVKFAEVTSVHGECLFEQRDPLNYRGCGDPPPSYTPGTAVMDAFKMGYRFVVIGGSDEHDGHPGHSLGHTAAYIGHQRPWTTWVNRIDLPHPGGLVAVLASNLTRENIFSGLEHQQVYGVSDHGRPYLEVSINGTKIGENGTFKVESGSDPRDISILLAQDGAPAANRRPNAASAPPNGIPIWEGSIEILKNGGLLTRIPISSPVLSVKYIDTELITGTSYGADNCQEREGQYYINQYSDNPIDPSTLNTHGADFYVIRVVGENGRCIYAGPIWIEVDGS